jgi:hypothetical protein
VEAVYDVSIPPETIQRRYLTTDEDGKVVPREKGLTLRTDYPDLKARVGPMFPVLVTLVSVPWLLLVALLLRAYRPGVREWVRQTIVWGSLGGLLVMWLWISLAAVFDAMQPWALRAVVEIPVFRMGQTAAANIGVWVAALALLAGSYGIVDSRFQRMEITTRPSRYTLIRMGHD